MKLLDILREHQEELGYELKIKMIATVLFGENVRDCVKLFLVIINTFAKNMNLVFKLIFVSLFVIPSIVIAQEAIIEKDTKSTIGVQLIDLGDKTNAQFVQQIVGAQIVRLTPDSIQAYEFANGKRYVSKNIDIDGDGKRVFLRSLSSGKLSLFSYSSGKRRRFFIQKQDSQLQEIRKSDCKSIFKDVTADFEWKKNQLNNLRFSKSNMSEFCSMYNEGLNNQIPTKKFGFVFGISNSKHFEATGNDVMNQTLYGDISYPYSKSYVVGVFAEFPLGSTNFAVNNEVDYFHFKTTGTSNEGYTAYDAKVKILDISSSCRYYIGESNLRPFVSGGPLLALNRGSSYTAYEVGTENEVYAEEINSNTWLGFSVGIGFEYAIKYKMPFNIELKYKNRHPTEIRTYGISSVDFVFGISLF